MSKKISYAITGMHCASCAGLITKALKKVPGVRDATVNFATESATVDHEDHLKTETLNESLKSIGYSLLPKGEQHNDHSAHTGINQTKQAKLEELAVLGRHLRIGIPLSVVAIMIMIAFLLEERGFMVINALWRNLVGILLPVMATYVLFVIGVPYLKGFWRFIKTGHANMDTLIGMGTLTAYIASFALLVFKDSLPPYLENVSYFEATIIIVVFITLGKYLEARSKLKTGEAIEKLLELGAKTALVVRDGKEVVIPIHEVVQGDTVRVLPGTKVPVDGVVVSGDSYIDEALVTGEPDAVHKREGDTVIGGTINTTGSLLFQATAVGSETMLARIVKMVENAQGSKAPIEALVDKISSIFTPTVLVISVITFFAWMYFGSQAFGTGEAFLYALTAFVTVLVIACPCALGLATPMSIVVGVGKGAQNGILIKDAASLERLGTVKTIVLDKTGTITKGAPEIISYKNHSNQHDDDIIGIIAGIEKHSEHPLAISILAFAEQKNITPKEATQTEAVRGKGISGTVDSVRYHIGGPAMMRSLNVSWNETELAEETTYGRTPIMLSDGKTLLTTILVADAIKDGAKEAIQSLHKLGIKTVMLSGDDQNTADFIGREVGIDTVIANVLPDEKQKRIKDLQSNGAHIAMVGDGVNDAPALAQADIGIAMSTGTDVAIESAGITLLHGDLTKLVSAIRLSRATSANIRQNLFFAFTYNTAGIPIAAGVLFPVWGVLMPPIFAGFAMAASSISVVSNALRLKSKKI